MKRLFSVVLALVMLMSSLAVFSSARMAAYQVGDIVEFGSYPQSKVTDESLISALNSLEKQWVSYDYSREKSGTSLNSQPVKSDFMKYADVTYNSQKYRAVTFSDYRGFYVGYGGTTSETGSSSSEQYRNGYYANEIYYFIYEPLKWRVLDPDTGLLLSEHIIDAQEFQTYNYIITINGERIWQNKEGKYASDYETSTIRAWLNDDFFNTSFTLYQQSCIQSTYLENKCPVDSKYDGASVTDKVFLLSDEDMLNSAYGFNDDRDNCPARKAKGSDYAQCQGLEVVEQCDGYSDWRLRTPFNSKSTGYVYYLNGELASYEWGGKGASQIASSGIRPAIVLDESIVSPTIKATVNNEFRLGEMANIDVTMSGNPSKISFVGSDGITTTFTPDDTRVNSITDNGNTTFTWNINLPVQKISETYKVYVRFPVSGWCEEYAEIAVNVKEFDISVKNFSIANSEDGVIYEGVNTVTVQTGTDAIKVQLYKDGNTWTYSTDSAQYSDDNGIRTWTLNMNFCQLGDQSYAIRTRSTKTAFEFSGETIDVTVYSK